MQDAARQFADSVLQLSASQLAAIGAVGGGSKVLEAYLEHAGNAKAVKKLLKKLHGSFGKLAATPSGCFLVEKCFSCAVRAASVLHASQHQPVLPADVK